MEFRPKLYLAAIIGLLVVWSAQSQASRHPFPMVQPTQTQAAGPPLPAGRSAQSAAARHPFPVVQSTQPQPVRRDFPVARSAQSEAGRHVVVERISIARADPFQLQVRTTAGVTPQAQVVTGPERLVIDVPGAAPGRTLRNQTVNRGQVEGVRVALFSAAPQVTRIVLDLNSPPAYRIQTGSFGFTVTLAGNTRPPSNLTSDDGKTIGWVASAQTNVVVRRDPFVMASRVPVPVNPNGVRVVVGKGQLEIHARNATLSEVLFQVEQQTGAEIAIPAGTEQQRVIGDFGPGTASEVLAQLLNGSDLNFVVVGTPNNPDALRSVILTHKAPGFAEYVPENATPGAEAVGNAPPDNSQYQPATEPRPEDLSRQLEDSAPQQPQDNGPQQPQDNAPQQPQDNAPPLEPVQD